VIEGCSVRDFVQVIHGSLEDSADALQGKLYQGLMTMYGSVDLTRFPLLKAWTTEILTTIILYNFPIQEEEKMERVRRALKESLIAFHSDVIIPTPSRIHVWIGSSIIGGAFNGPPLFLNQQNFNSCPISQRVDSVSATSLESYLQSKGITPESSRMSSDKVSRWVREKDDMFFKLNSPVAPTIQFTGGRQGPDEKPPYYPTGQPSHASYTAYPADLNLSKGSDIYQVPQVVTAVPQTQTVYYGSPFYQPTPTVYVSGGTTTATVAVGPRRHLSAVGFISIIVLLFIFWPLCWVPLVIDDCYEYY